MTLLSLIGRPQPKMAITTSQRSINTVVDEIVNNQGHIDIPWLSAILVCVDFFVQDEQVGEQKS